MKFTWPEVARLESQYKNSFCQFSEKKSRKNRFFKNSSFSSLCHFDHKYIRTSLCFGINNTAICVYYAKKMVDVGASSETQH